jgi:hypothetical protein
VSIQKPPAREPRGVVTRFESVSIRGGGQEKFRPSRRKQSWSARIAAYTTDALLGVDILKCVPALSNDITVLHSTMLYVHQCLKYVLLRSLCGAKSSPPSALIWRLVFLFYSSVCLNDLSIAKVFEVARAAPALNLQQNSRRYVHARWVRFQPVAVRRDLSSVKRQITLSSQPVMLPIQDVPTYVIPGQACE